jgi:hypothetical protein
MRKIDIREIERMQRMEGTIKVNPSRCVIYLDSMRADEIKGCLYSEHYKKCVRFKSEVEMLSAMQDLFDSVDFPQTLFESRSFFGKKSRKTIVKAEAIMHDDLQDLMQNPKTTFVVNVQYRQNATWQGTITWAEQNRTKHFRSALEMLRLMEEASSQGASEFVDWSDEE